MIEKFVLAWDKNKNQLKEKIKSEPIGNYQDLLMLLVSEVINPEMNDYEKIDIEKMTVIDDGDYQGTQIYLIPKETYQPSVEEYIVTYNYYGSCSGCDALLAALGWDDDDKDIDSLMAISLHLLQRMKWLSEEKNN